MKFNATIKTLLPLMILAGLAVTAHSQDEPAAKVKEMNGKELYKTLCKSCHMEDSEAGEYTPMSLIMDQWDEFFDGGFAETHKEISCPQDKDKKVTDMIDKEMIKKLRKFCVDHAADSEQPMTCG